MKKILTIFSIFSLLFVSLINNIPLRAQSTDIENLNITINTMNDKKTIYQFLSLWSVYDGNVSGGYWELWRNGQPTSSAGNIGNLYVENRTTASYNYYDVYLDNFNVFSIGYKEETDRYLYQNNFGADIGEDLFLFFYIDFEDFNSAIFWEIWGKGEEIGYINGSDIGYNQGRIDGYDKGFLIGYEQAIQELENDFKEGFNEGKEQYGILINNVWHTARQAKDIAIEDTKEQYGIFYNNKWYNAEEWGHFRYNQALKDLDIKGIDVGLVGFIPSILGTIGAFFFTLGSVQVMGVSIIDLVALIVAVSLIFIVLKMIKGGD